MNAEAIIAIVSVCITGLVSILGVLVPAYLASRKSEQETNATKIERIYEKAEQLSVCLAKFRNVAYLKEIGKDHEVRIELRANYDAWHMSIFPELKPNECKRVTEMRGKLGFRDLTGMTEEGNAKIMELIDSVVELTCSAVDTVNKSSSNFRLRDVIKL